MQFLSTNVEHAQLCYVAHENGFYQFSPKEGEDLFRMKATSAASGQAIK